MYLLGYMFYHNQNTDLDVSMLFNIITLKLDRRTDSQPLYCLTIAENTQKSKYRDNVLDTRLEWACR